MLIEISRSKSHVQLGDTDAPPDRNCIATVRVEYVEAVKAAIEAQMASVANRDHTEDKEHGM